MYNLKFFTDVFHCKLCLTGAGHIHFTRCREATTTSRNTNTAIILKSASRSAHRLCNTYAAIIAKTCIVFMYLRIEQRHRAFSSRFLRNYM